MARRQTNKLTPQDLEQQVQDQHNLSDAQINHLVAQAENEGTSRAETLRKLQSANDLDDYARSRGFPNFEAIKEAESAQEKSRTNDRLTTSAERTARINSLKDLATTSSLVPGGDRYSKAALDAFAKEAGVTVPEPVDAKQAAFNALKGKPTTPKPTTPTQAPTPSAGLNVNNLVQNSNPQGTLFTPEAQPPRTGRTAQPVSNGNEPVAGVNEIKGPWGVGGALVTPNNPTGNPSNPWGPGGLFANNPTHLAAVAQQQQQTATYPTGHETFGGQVNYGTQPNFGDQSQPTNPAANPANLVKAPAATNVPPKENVQPTPVNNFSTQPTVAGAPHPADAFMQHLASFFNPQQPTTAPSSGWNTHPGGTLIGDWADEISKGRNANVRTPGLVAAQ